MYVYILSDKNPDLFTVGHYKPDGEWESENDYTEKEEAADRVAFLNGAIKLAPTKGYIRFENGEDLRAALPSLEVGSHLIYHGVLHKVTGAGKQLGRRIVEVPVPGLYRED